MWSWIRREFGGRFSNRRAQAGGAETQGETLGGDTLAGDFTVEDLENAAHDVVMQQRRRRRRPKNANQIRLNLRERLTTHGAKGTVLGKPTAPGGELEQDAADALYAQTLAEQVLELEEDEFQSRVRYTHLGYAKYMAARRRNREHHRKLLHNWENNDVGKKRPETVRSAASNAPPPPNADKK